MILLSSFVKLLKDCNSANDAGFSFYAVWFCAAFVFYLQRQATDQNSVKEGGDGSEEGTTGRWESHFIIYQDK